MELSITLTLPDEVSKDDLVAAIRNAGERVAGQIEFGLLPYPPVVDETIDMGCDVEDVDVIVFRIS